MKKYCLVAAGCAAMLGAGTLSAQAEKPYDEIIVTATRTQVPVSETLSPVTVISREDIQSLQPLDLGDVFEQVPGLDVQRSGGPGSNLGLFMRGTQTDHTLVLVDGQRISSATVGGASLHIIDPAQVERIEIVRGADSSLYGSEAIGGVIQIFTRDGSGASDSYVSTAAGSNDLREVSAGTNNRIGNVSYGFNASYLDTEGFDSRVETDGFSGDRDGYRNRSVNASVGYAFNGGANLSLKYLHTRGRNDYDSQFQTSQQPYLETWVQNVKAKLDLPLTEFWQSRLSLGRSTDDSQDYDDITNMRLSHFRTRREQALWQNDLTLTDNQTLTLGLEYYEDQVDASTAFEDSQSQPVTSRDNQAVFLQHQGQFNSFSMVVGARTDDNEEFGEHTTGNISLGYQLQDNHRLYASWSEGFKAPTFNDLYWPFLGNPNLLPETSDHYELGVRGAYEVWHWSANYFESDIDNLIDWAPNNAGVWRPSNVNHAEIDGGELMAGVDVSGWQLETSLSYVDPVDAQTGEVLTNRAKKTAGLRIAKTWERWRFGVDLKAQGERYLATADNLPGYSVVNARVEYHPSEHWSAKLKITNLLDKDYRLNSGYNQDDRGWRLGIHYAL